MFVSFRYKRLVFGLKSRDSIFQALMDILLEELQLEGDSQIRMTSSWIQIFRGNVYKILNLSSKYNLTHSSKNASFTKLMLTIWDSMSKTTVFHRLNLILKR